MSMNRVGFMFSLCVVPARPAAPRKAAVISPHFPHGDAAGVWERVDLFEFNGGQIANAFADQPFVGINLLANPANVCRRRLKLAEISGNDSLFALMIGIIPAINKGAPILMGADKEIVAPE